MYLYIFLTSLCIFALGACEATSGYCVDHGYSPENGSRKPAPQQGLMYFPNTVLRYECDQYFLLASNETCQKCLYNGSSYDWQPKKLPSCVELPTCMKPEITHGYLNQEVYHQGDYMHLSCDDGFCIDNENSPLCLPDGSWSFVPGCRACSDYTTEVTSSTMNNHAHCPKPDPIENGIVNCCPESQAGINSTKDPYYCCPQRGLVKFVCNTGYTLKGEPNQWICGTDGDWLVLDSDTPRQPERPKCFENNTMADLGAFGDGTLKQVLAVAAGVLVILTAIMVFALCRPKLIDMKRRWRELRDDDDELIIDGRRILLPSYEEAMTSRDQCLSEEQGSSQLFNDVPGSSDVENRRTELETVSEISIGPTDITRPLSSSDDEMLIPGNLSRLHDGNPDSNTHAQSLTLVAGTSVDSSVLLNPRPRGQYEDDSSHSECASNTHTNTINSSVNLWGEESSDDSMLVLEGNSDSNLEIIYPQRLLNHNSSANQRNGIGFDQNLLSCPLIPTEQSAGSFSGMEPFTANINPESLSMPCESDKMEDIVPEDVDVHEDFPEIDNNTNPSEQMLENSEHVHISLLPQVALHDPEEMGSTAV